MSLYGPNGNFSNEHGHTCDVIDDVVCAVDVTARLVGLPPLISESINAANGLRHLMSEASSGDEPEAFDNYLLDMMCLTFVGVAKSYKCFVNSFDARCVTETLACSGTPILRAFTRLPCLVDPATIAPSSLRSPYFVEDDNLPVKKAKHP